MSPKYSPKTIPTSTSKLSGRSIPSHPKNMKLYSHQTGLHWTSNSGLTQTGNSGLCTVLLHTDRVACDN